MAKKKKNIKSFPSDCSRFLHVILAYQFRGTNPGFVVFSPEEKQQNGVKWLIWFVSMGMGLQKRGKFQRLGVPWHINVHVGSHAISKGSRFS